jgi:hypothetical protein
VKKVIGLVVLGIGGLAAAVALTVGALALAGDDVGSVVQPTVLPSDSSTPSPSKGEDHRSLTPSPSVDDHGGSSGSDDPIGSDDHSGSGSSGSGSSGSDSGSSGSGSSDSHDDD